jgi:4-hydroxy-tetrahydrodipicolinate reductase
LKLALLGYGKMGKAIEKIALSRGHEIVVRAGSDASSWKDLQKADAAIEFSVPASAPESIRRCFAAGIPVVVGTTGWYEHFEQISKECIEKGQSLFTATNFSIGVNIFFEVNKKLAELMNDHPAYSVSMEEVHHTHKLDAPSGTAISLANQVLEKIERLSAWENMEKGVQAVKGILNIESKRIDEVPGTHTVTYDSAVDSIEIKHTAHSREGFALGAVLAAEWLPGRKGVFGMEHLLKLS